MELFYIFSCLFAVRLFAEEAPSGADTGDDDELTAWVKAARQGDKRAFDQIVLMFQTRMYNLSLNYVKQAEEAQDLTQDIFVTAYKALSTGDGQIQAESVTQQPERPFEKGVIDKMMNCRSCQDLFSAHLDRELDGQTMANLMRHLGECPGCADEWRCFQQTVTLLNALGQMPVPAGILPEIRRKLEALESESVIVKILAWLKAGDFSFSLPVAAATVAAAIALMIAVKNLPFASIDQITPPQTTDAGSSRQNVSEVPASAGKIAETGHVRRADSYWHLPSGLLATDIFPVITAGGQQSLSQGETGTPGSAALFSATAARNVGHDGWVAEPAYSAPDIVVVVSKRPDSDHGELLNRLLDEEKWQGAILDATHLRLRLDPADMPALQKMLSSHNTEFYPPHARNIVAGYPKKELAVTIALR